MYKSMCLVAVCSLLLVSAGPALGQAKKAVPKAAKKGSSPQDAAMAAMARASAVGPQHELLKSMAGSYTTQSSAWMAPGKPPVKSPGTSEHELVFGGRFLRQEFKGTMMGQPFTGLGFTGFDNLKQKYVAIWMDSMMTGVLVLEGTMDAAGKVLTMEGMSDDPVSGKPQKLRTVTRIESDKKHLWQMEQEVPGGKMVKMVEIVYSRK